MLGDFGLDLDRMSCCGGPIDSDHILRESTKPSLLFVLRPVSNRAPYSASDKLTILGSSRKAVAVTRNDTNFLHQIADRAQRCDVREVSRHDSNSKLSKPVFSCIDRCDNGILHRNTR